MIPVYRLLLCLVLVVLVARAEATPVFDVPFVDGITIDGSDDDWVLREDVAGQMGWEPEKLPESERWWAHWTFEDLPPG